MGEKVTFSLPCLKTLLATENSCVFCKKGCRRSLKMLPIHLSDLNGSVREMLASKATFYDLELDGIILSHKKIRIHDTPNLSDIGTFVIDYTADIYLFKPSIGSVLTGQVNKKCRDYLGCLVHSVFYVTIPKPTGKKWLGKTVQHGQTITFTVVKLDYTTRLPHIVGQLMSVKENDDEGMDSGVQESLDEEFVVQKKKKKDLSHIFSPSTSKRKFADLEMEEGPKKKKKRVQLENGVDDHAESPKKNRKESECEDVHVKKKKKKIKDNSEEVQHKEETDYQIPEVKKKKKKKKENSISQEVDQPQEDIKDELLAEALSSIDDLFQNQKINPTEAGTKKKKKKTKDEPLSSIKDQLLSSALASIEPKTSEAIESPKKKKKPLDNIKDELLASALASIDSHQESVEETKKKKKKKKRDLDEDGLEKHQKQPETDSHSEDTIKKKHKKIKSTDSQSEDTEKKSKKVLDIRKYFTPEKKHQSVTEDPDLIRNQLLAQVETSLKTNKRVKNQIDPPISPKKKKHKDLDMKLIAQAEIFSPKAKNKKVEDVEDIKARLLNQALEDSDTSKAKKVKKAKTENTTDLVSQLLAQAEASVTKKKKKHKKNVDDKVEKSISKT